MVENTQGSALPQSSRANLHLLLGLVVLLLGIWANSGTLSPYAASHHTPFVSEPCKYLFNLDHAHFLGTYLFLDGADPSTWSWSVYLRRLLYPLLAYPAMKLLGFEWGGFVTNLPLHAIAFMVFHHWLRRVFGAQTAIYGGWLVATYPGIAYWGALPYAHASMVPCLLVLTVLLDGLRTRATWPRVSVSALGMGILMLAYDFLPFFGPAAALLLTLQRRFAQAIVATGLMALPNVVLGLVLKNHYGVSPINSNTEVYRLMLEAYLNPPAWHVWAPYFSSLPYVALVNYLYSNFLFLPLLGIIAALLGAHAKIRPSLTEGCMALAIVCVFLVNNVAPPYPGWQMRGDWIPRLYQALALPIIVYSLRVCAHYCSFSGSPSGLPRGAIRVAIIGTILLNSLVVFGAHIGLSIAGPLYYRFYRHSTPEAYADNLARFGARPLGFCTRPSPPETLLDSPL